DGYRSNLERPWTRHVDVRPHDRFFILVLAIDQLKGQPHDAAGIRQSKVDRRLRNGFGKTDRVVGVEYPKDVGEAMSVSVDAVGNDETQDRGGRGHRLTSVACTRIYS